MRNFKLIFELSRVNKNLKICMLYLSNQPSTVQCCFSIPPENIRKPEGFSDVFRGFRKAIPGYNGLRWLTWLI